MKCQDIERNIDAYCAGYLPEDMTQVIEKHLAGCSDCALSLFEQDESFDSLLAQNWYGYTPSVDFADGVMTRINAAPPRHKLYVWLIPMWAFYMTVWGALGLWIFAGSRVENLLQPAFSLARAVFVVLGTLRDVLSVVQISELGAFLVFGLSLVVFSGIGLLGKEVKQ